MEFLIKYLVLLVVVLLSFREHQEVLAELVRGGQKVADERKLFTNTQFYDALNDAVKKSTDALNNAVKEWGENFKPGNIIGEKAVDIEEKAGEKPANLNGVNSGAGGDCVDGASCPHGHCVCGRCATVAGKQLNTLPCENNDMCLNGYCSGLMLNCGGVCKPFVPLNLPCETDYSCYPANIKCIDGKCADPTCVDVVFEKDPVEYFWDTCRVDTRAQRAALRREETCGCFRREHPLGNFGYGVAWEVNNGVDCVDGASCPHGHCVCGQCAKENGKLHFNHRCENDDMCDSGFCDGSQISNCGGVCRPFKRLTQSCERDYSCYPADLKCIDGECAHPACPDFECTIDLLKWLKEPMNCGLSRKERVEVIRLETCGFLTGLGLGY